LPTKRLPVAFAIVAALLASSALAGCTDGDVASHSRALTATRPGAVSPLPANPGAGQRGVPSTQRTTSDAKTTGIPGTRTKLGITKAFVASQPPAALQAQVPPAKPSVDWLVRYSESRPAYRALARGDCAAALSAARKLSSRTRSLYRAAARACLAQQGNRPDLWDAARGDQVALAGSRKWTDCRDADVHLMLGRLLDRQGPSAASTTCPRVVKVSPDRGRANATLTLTLTGSDLPKRVTVKVGDHMLKPVRVSADRTAVIKAPSRRDAGGKRSVGVQLAQWQASQPSASFTYKRA
jgi:hypothetical protein